MDFQKVIESKILDNKIQFSNTQFIEIINGVREMTEKEFIFENAKYKEKLNNFNLTEKY